MEEDNYEKSQDLLKDSNNYEQQEGIDEEFEEEKDNQEGKNSQQRRNHINNSQAMQIQGTQSQKQVSSTKPEKYIFNTVIDFSHLSQSTQFSGQYEQSLKHFYKANFICLNTKKIPMIPLRTPKCRKLCCILQDKGQKQVYSCCSGIQYNYSEMVLDWRILSIMKNIDFEIQQQKDQYEILLINNKIILYNIKKDKEYYQQFWEESNWSQTDEDSRNYIKDQIKLNCYQNLKNHQKFEKQLTQAENLYNIIVRSDQFKYLRNIIRKEKSDFDMMNNIFMNKQKPGTYYIEKDHQFPHIYYSKDNQSIITMHRLKFKSKFQNKMFFRNHQNVLFSIDDNKIYKFEFQKNQKDGQLIQKEFKTIKLLTSLSDGTSVIYNPQQDEVYIAGGDKSPKRMQIINLKNNNNQIQVTNINGLQACQRCQMTIGGDGNIYILPQNPELIDSQEKISIFRFKPKERELKRIYLTITFKEKKIFKDKNSIFSTIFADSHPYLFLSFFDFDQNKCFVAIQLIKEMDYPSPKIKMQQILQVPKFCQDKWITDSAGIILANSSQFLAKVQTQPGVYQIKRMALSLGEKSYFNWKVISC